MAASTDDPVPTRAVIDHFYLALLGRKPESEQTIRYYLDNSTSTLISTLTKSIEFQKKNRSDPLFAYNSPLDCEGIIKAHARRDLKPDPEYYINFLGAKVPPRFLPRILEPLAGRVEPIPNPGNWHADIAEWAAALRAVDLAHGEFRMAELGCGWGCWMINTGLAAKRRGLSVRVYGVEADEGHVAFAQEACLLNGFTADEFELSRGVATAEPGVALFPRQAKPGEQWGNAPILNASADEAAQLSSSGHYDIVQKIPLQEIERDGHTLDLVHIDIQGGEADLVRSSLQYLTQSVNYLVIGTHSRQIEGKLFETLEGEDWELEVERPAIFGFHQGNAFVRIDGLQGWRNRRRSR